MCRVSSVIQFDWVDGKVGFTQYGIEVSTAFNCFMIEKSVFFCQGFMCDDYGNTQLAFLFGFLVESC